MTCEQLRRNLAHGREAIADRANVPAVLDAERREKTLVETPELEVAKPEPVEVVHVRELVEPLTPVVRILLKPDARVERCVVVLFPRRLMAQVAVLVKVRHIERVEE